MVTSAERATGTGPVTVVIATRNRRDELLHTLTRLRALPERPPVIVVDNASSDGTAAVVGELFPEAGLITLPRNLGAPARNVGVEAARTPYVAFSDDDSWWEPGALGLASGILAADPGLGLIAGRLLVGAARVPDPIEEVLAARASGEPGPPVLGFLSCASVVRRRAFLEAGGFSPVLFFPGEEQLLAYDLAALGWDRRYIPAVVAVHEPSKLRAPAPVRRRAELRNALLTVWLRRSARVVLRETLRLAVDALRNPDARAAMLGALRRAPYVVIDRRPLPASVEAAARLIEGRGRPRPASAPVVYGR